MWGHLKRRMRRYFIYGLVVRSRKTDRAIFWIENKHHPAPENTTEDTTEGTPREPRATLDKYKSYAFMADGSDTNRLS